MKRALNLGILALAVLASAQTVQTARAYKVGETDAYHVALTMEGAMALKMSMDTSQKVLAVYDNGDADVESAVTDMTLDMMGQKRTLPAQTPVKSRITKYGTPVAGSAAAPPGRRGMPGVEFTKYLRQLPHGEMKVGQTVEIDETDPTNEKTHIKGHSTLESVKDGVGKIVTSLDVSAEGSTKPMHLDFTSTVESATSRPMHIEGKITNLEGAGGLPRGMPITAVTIVMDRKA